MLPGERSNSTRLQLRRRVYRLKWGYPDMTGAAGFVATLAEFIVRKMLDRKIELALDEKKQAARAFLDLYESLSCLERALTDFEHQIHNVVCGNADRLYAVPVQECLRGIQDGTNLFIKSLRRLEHVIEIFDPSLGDMLFGIRDFKIRSFGALDVPTELELKLIWGNPESVFVIEVHEASTGIGADLSKLLGQIYDRAPFFEKKFQEERNSLFQKKARGSIVSEDTRFLRSEFLRQPISTREIPSNDKEQLKDLLVNVRDHISSLSSSRNYLAEFIRHKFSLEDLLR